MRDVAKAVGVSPMTVSRALRDDQTVSVETRFRIQEAARNLGYIYDTTALAFRTQRSGFVAITLPSVNNASFADTFRSFSSAITGSGMQTLLGATNYRIEREEELVGQLLARNPEALVMTGGHHTETTRELVRKRNLPVIEIWDLPARPLGHVVGFSNAEAMGVVVRHLADLGHRKLAFVGASEGGDLRGAERRDGTKHAAASLGLPEVAFLDAGPAPVTMRQGAELAKRFGKRLLDFDAVVCVSDPVAFGVLSECRRMGIEVPKELAITGFGYFDVAVVSEPNITTVDVGAKRIGTVAAEMLAEIFAGISHPRTVDVGARLVVGATT
ncbi:MAG: LacI family DNA-binding transcriptional regulator [Pseudomonadota bacterium]